MKRLAAVALIGLLGGLIACSDTPSAPEKKAQPSWTSGPVRTVDNGYIVYVGSGEDSSSDERAQFKAEGAALEDLANECSFVPKGARLEDRFEKTEGPLHEAWAKVAVEFQACEDAKHAISPDDVRRLANATMTEQIQKYQAMLGEKDDLQKAKEYTELDVPPEPGPAPADNSNLHFFVMRQQIAMEKQTVILAPPATYAPAAPATQKYVAAVQAPTQQVLTYANTHPDLVKSPTQVWSQQQKAVHQVMVKHDTRPALKIPARPENARAQGKSGRKGGRGKGRRRGSQSHSPEPAAPHGP